MPILNGFIIICFSVFVIVLVGFYNVILNREENGCNMTYMYEYPQFVRISLGVDVARKYKAYNLWAYGEGRFTEKVREMKFTGIPVLFIHGNRGSYKQVRSLSSISLRRALRSRSPFHFDYFSVDLNEEYSGFYGGILEKQTEFVRLCINKILTLYRGDRPDSVALFAHSMGGMIAKGLFLRDMDWSQVRVIVTLATPHRPAVLLDYAASTYYDQVTRFWDETNVGDNVTLISIGGGSRDLVIHSGLSYTPHADISVVTSEIAGVWLETDHLCITWCKELVLVLVRAMFDCVDTQTKQISNDIQLRESVFKYHLLERSGSKIYSVARGAAPGRETVLWKGEKDNSSWLKLRKNQLTWSRKERISVATHILVPLSSINQPADTLLVRTANHNTEHWLFACRPDVSVSNIKVCSTGEDISWRGRISPTKDYKRKTALIDLLSLRMEGKTHIVVRTLPTSELVEISFDLFIYSERGSRLQPGYLLPIDLIQNSPPGQLFRWLEIPGLSRPWNAFILRVSSHPGNCSTSHGGHSSISVDIPWNHEGSHIVLGEERRSVPVSIYTAKPQKKGTKSVQVAVYLNPECSYSIRLEQSIWLAVGRLVVGSYPSLLAFLSVCLIMCIAKQLRCLGESASCPLLHIIASTAAKPYYILPAANIASSVARFLYPHIGKSDVHSQSGLVETLVLPLLYHCTSVALLLIFASMVLIGVVFHGQAFNSVILKFISKLCMGLPWISEWIMSGVSKLPVIVSGLMLAISYSACSSLAIYIGLIFYFIKLVSYYEDFWEEVVYWPLRAMKAAIMSKLGKRRVEIEPLELPPLRDISFHLSLFLLWTLIAFITTPSLLSWAHNFRYSSWLENDPFFPVGVVLSFCGGFLWQADTPRTNLKWSREISEIIMSSCIAVLVYCQMSLYRLQTVLCMVMVFICCHQFAAPPDPDLEDPDIGPPSALSTISASFIKCLDSLLGTKPPHSQGKTTICSETTEDTATPQMTEEGGAEEDKSDEESSDRAQLSAELSSDISDRAELTDQAEISASDMSFQLSAAEQVSSASFDPMDRPMNGDLETTNILDRQPVKETLSSNSSFENISFSDIKG